MHRASRRLIRASVSAALLLCAGASIAAESPLNGAWVIEGGKGVLEISGNRWFHPAHGSATLRLGEGSSDLEVFYHADQGIRCAYRAYVTEYGQKLVLEPGDSTQSSEYCPHGTLARVNGRVR